MKIVLNDHRKIFAIQDEFSKLFPNLKIEFFAKPSKTGSAPSKKLVKQSSKTLLECRSTHTEGVIEVVPSMSVMELKDNFRDIYGLSVALFRKSGKSLSEEPGSDRLTLQEQNESK